MNEPMPSSSSAQDSLFDLPTLVCRYLLVIDPPEAVRTEVKELKQMLSGMIGSFSGSSSVPHITLFYADLPPEMERDLCAGIEGGCKGQLAFHLHLRGVKHFADKKTIYIDPVEKDAVGTLRRSIVAHTRSYRAVKKRGVKPTDSPHLTIAAGLGPHQFEQAWAKLWSHGHTSLFHVSEVKLLRRALLPGATYKEVRSFKLG